MDTSNEYQEVHKKRVQNMYPLKIELKHCINNGVAKNEHARNSLHDANRAVRLTIEIDYEQYNKAEVAQAVKEICQKAVEYFY